MCFISCIDSSHGYDFFCVFFLFRNDGIPSGCGRSFGGTAVYSRIDYYPGYPYILNQNGIEITVLRFLTLPQVTIVATYCSPRVPITHLCTALRNLLISLPKASNIFIGDFNINWLSESEEVPLLIYFFSNFNIDN